MSKIAKLRKKVRKLKRENLSLIIEANEARVRAGEAHEVLDAWGARIQYAKLSDWDWTEVPLDG